MYLSGIFFFVKYKGTVATALILAFDCYAWFALGSIIPSSVSFFLKGMLVF